MAEMAVKPELSVGEKAHRPIVELLLLAGPTVVQMASYTLMQFIDVWMLSRVGVDEPTAAANMGLLAFATISFGMGVLWVVNTLVSQNYGQRDYLTCGKYLWQGIWFSVIYSALLTPLVPLAGPVLKTFGHEPALAARETVYFQIVLAATLVKMVGTAFGQFLLATNRPGQVLMATVFGVGVNALAAWGIVLGHWGLPAMGVKGAAWAQNIGVTVETLILVMLAMRGGVRKVFGVRQWRLRWKEMRLLLKLGLPSGAQAVADVMAWTLFSLWVMAKFGTAAMAANAFMLRYMAVSFMPAVGIGTAVTALVGRYIGRGEPDVAERRAHLGFVLTAAYMVACGVAFFVGREWLIRVFRPDEEVVRIGAVLMTFSAVYQFFDALYINYNGALRARGIRCFRRLRRVCCVGG